jgi:hypothetical protein
VAQHFTVHRLCDATSDLGDPSTWAMLRNIPPRLRDLEDPKGYRDTLMERAQAMREQDPDRVETEIVALALVALGATQAGELDQLLRATLPALFDRFPHGSLLYLTDNRHGFVRVGPPAFRSPMSRVNRPRSVRS